MKINFVGDLCLHKIESDKFDIEDGVLEILRDSDLNIANLESPLTLKESIRPNTPVALKAEPKNNSIYDLFHVFSLANNHILDYGVEGFFDTISFLKKSGKKYFYQDAANITNQTTKMLKKLAAELDLKNLLMTLKRVKKQDINIILYALFLKKMKKISFN